MLLEIEKNEKSSFDDVITGAESDNGWEDCLRETESVQSQWITEQSTIAYPETTRVNCDGPQSYYELADLNYKPAENTVRLARVPSQYQLDALSEIFVFDVPQHIAVKKVEASFLPKYVNTSSEVAQNSVNTTPYFVNSEYVSEMLCNEYSETY